MKIGIEIDSEGEVVVTGKKIAEVGAAAFGTLCENGARATIKADPSVPYARVIDLVDALKSAGCTRIAFGVDAKP